MSCSLCLALTVPLIASFLVIAYQVYRFVFRPYSQLQHYKKQGLGVSFVPFYGYRKQCVADLQSKGDILYSWKQVNFQNPKPRAFAANAGDKPIVALKDPELIKQFYQIQEKSYVKSADFVGLAKLALRNGTLLAEGQVWKNHRRLTAPLYSYQAIQERVPEITKIVNDALDNLTEKELANFDFLRGVQHILAEVTGRLFIGIDISKLVLKGKTAPTYVADLVDAAGLEAHEPLTVLLTVGAAGYGLHARHRQLAQDVNDLRGFLAGACKAKIEEIRQQKKEGKSSGIPLLLEAIHDQKDKLPKEDFDEIDVVDELAMFVVGSTDTTAHAIDYASYFILQNQGVQNKLREEINGAFKDLSQVSAESLNQMNYLSAVFKESLRMAAPLPLLLPRIATEDNKLGDLDIRAGTLVTVASVCNNFDPEYHDEPEKFEPERWIDENSRTKKSTSKSPYVYIPFSSGARACPGLQYGTLVSKIVLSLIVKKFNYSLVDSSYKMAYSGKFFSEPLQPLVYKLERK